MSASRLGRGFAELREAGAPVQRPLWASTGVKDPSYPDTMYVTELVAPDTVNTMPEATIVAIADHGEFADDSVTANYADAQDVLDRMERVGVAYDDVVKVVEAEGVDKFEKAGQEMIDTVSAALEQAKK